VTTQIQEALARRLGYKPAGQKTYHSAIVGAVDAGMVRSWEKREPVERQRTLSADYFIPLLSSVTTGAFGGAALAVVLGIEAGGIAAVLLSGAAWLYNQASTARLNWRVERLVGRDIDGDGWIGEPQPAPQPLPPPRTVQVEHIERRANNHWRMHWEELPTWLTDDKLGALAQLIIVEGASFSRRGIERAISQDEYPAIVEAFKSARFIFPRGRGWELTGSGRRFLGKFLDD